MVKDNWSYSSIDAHRCDTMSYTSHHTSYMSELSKAPGNSSNDYNNVAKSSSSSSAMPASHSASNGNGGGGGANSAWGDYVSKEHFMDMHFC